MRDAGLQAERTALAWRRTALGVLANALLLVRAGLVGHHAELLVLGLLLLGAAGVTQGCSVWRRRGLSGAEPAAAVSAAALLMVTLLAAGCSAAALLAICLESAGLPA